MQQEIVEKGLSFEIMKAAYAVHSSLGPGFLESIYEQAMCLELEHQGQKVERQVRVPVRYRRKEVGLHVIDIIVNKKIILELKAINEIAPIHKQQALSYLKATDLHLAIVINFGSRRVQSARVVNTKRE
jgi:GxxExxY protein